MAGGHPAVGIHPGEGVTALRLAGESDRVAGLLLSRDRFRPFPTAADRDAWAALPAARRTALIALGSEYLGTPWPALPATLFMAFRRDGNRSRYERASAARRSALSALVVAECVEAEGRFMDAVIDGLWSVCEESFWGVPAHNDGRDALPDVERPVFDLFAGETAALLAWTDYLLGPQLAAVSARLRARLHHEVDRRILTPFLEREDFWWMGLRGESVNNWNPWCVSNALAASLLLEEGPSRRAALVTKALRCLDRFLAAYPPDGGCDEGTSYWDRAGGALFDCLELLHAATGGAIDVYDQPLIREIGRFLYRMHIAGDWFVNFADGAARVRISADLVHRYGQRIGDSDLAALGAAAYRAQRAAGAPWRGPLPRLLPALFHLAVLEGEAARATAPDPPQVWLPDIQVMTARERGGATRGLFVAAKGGHNGESHNHNDVGQFIIYLDGCPAVVDAGVGTYTAQTFGPERYALWTMRSPYHNLPTVSGHEQCAGRAFAARSVAYRAESDLVELSLDLAGAYPPEAGVLEWRRRVRLVRPHVADGGAGDQERLSGLVAAGLGRAAVPSGQGDGGTGLGHAAAAGADATGAHAAGDAAPVAPVVEVWDDFRLAQATSDLQLTLLLAQLPDLTVPGRMVVPVGDLRALHVHYAATALAAFAEPIALQDARLSAVWGDRLWRVTLQARQAAAVGHWRLRFSASVRSAG